jgi:hypothetical protein
VFPCAPFITLTSLTTRPVSKNFKPFGVIERVLDWCKSELTGEWRWQLLEVSSDHRPGRYIFYFDSERDYLAFVMKWS